LIVNLAFIAPVKRQTEKGLWRGNAYNKSIGSEGKSQDRKKSDDTRVGQFAAAAGGVCQGLYLYTQETEFRFEKSGQSKADQRV
jgi:hypothetical protein